MNQPVQPEYKRGRLGHPEMNFIRENIKTLGLNETSKHLNRSPDLVSQFARSEGIVYEEDLEDDSLVVQASINKDLRKSLDWQALQEEFMETELEFFAYRYSKLMSQFKDDVFPTEETQIFQLIKFEILMQRNLKGAKRAGHRDCSGRHLFLILSIAPIMPP
jgi:hypothetical protein